MVSNSMDPLWREGEFCLEGVEGEELQREVIREGRAYRKDFEERLKCKRKREKKVRRGF